MSEEISIHIKGPSELKLTINIAPVKTVRDLKQAVAEASDVEADRQRLIYSGKVLKDEDALATYKIQSGHTVHMVKGVAQTNASGSTSTTQPLPAMQAGQNPADPLTQLNGPRGHGLAGFNPFAGTGVNLNDPNMMQSMLESPAFLQQMSAVMSNPQIMEQLISSDPNMAAMAPQLRLMFNNPQFREMVSNPEQLRQMFQMAGQMRTAGFDATNPASFGTPFGLLGPNAFGTGAGSPTAGSPTSGAGATGATTGAQPQNLFAQAAGGANPAGGSGVTPALNPWAALLGAGAPGANGAGSTPNSGASGGTTGSPATPNAAANPFGMVDPNLLQQMFGGFGGGGWPGMGATPTAPADSRPPEERFQVQLQQLQDMGFSNASQNVRALLATGGNVHTAIEYILGGGGL